MNKNGIMEPNLRAAPNFQRRALFVGPGLAAMAVGLGSPAFGQFLSESDNPIRQPADPSEETFIRRAFEMRQSAIDFGDQAYGAVIVRDNVIIGQSWSRVVLDQDPTAHAEMAAIRDAARRLNSRDLQGASLYSSSRPCPMCEAAAFWAGVDQMIYGRRVRNAGSPKLCG